jgi:hypothetical protein
MTPRKLHAFRLDEDLFEGLQAIQERDGVLISEQVRRAIRAWLEAKGVAPRRAERKRADTRKRS